MSSETEETGTRRPGRPPDPRKRDAILAAARQVFVADGYAASMDRVAEAAGVSKQTIYKHFESKEALFEAIVRQRSDRLTGPLLTAPADAAVETVLHGLALRFLELLTLPDYACILRVLVGTQGQFPGLADHFYEVGPRRSLGRLADYLARMDRQGALRVPDPLLAAEQFLGLVNGQMQMRMVLGIATDTDPALMDARARAAVAVFLKAYGPPGPCPVPRGSPAAPPSP